MKKALKPGRQALHAQIDNAVALSDRAVGIDAPETLSATALPPFVPAMQAPFNMPGAQRTGTPSLTPNPQSPIPNSVPPTPAPEKISVGAYQARVNAGWVPVVGVPGTPIAAGFLNELGEYNPKMMGLNAIWTYQEMRRGCAQVASTLDGCKAPILSAEWQVKAVPDNELKKGQTHAQAAETADMVRENLFSGLEWQDHRGSWHTQNWKDVIRIALRMLDFGAACFEEILTVDGGQIRARRLADRQALTFYRWHTDPHEVDPDLPKGVYDDGETLYALEQWGYRGSSFNYVKLPMDKACLFVREQEGANFWGIPITRAMYPHWYLRGHLERMNAIACERNGMGVPVILLPPNPSKQDVSTAQAWVTSLAVHEKTGLSLPNGAEFKLVGIEGQVREILPFIEYEDTQIAKRGFMEFQQLGQKQSGSGSRAVGGVQSKFFYLSSQITADDVASAIRNSTIRRLVMFNCGPDAPVPYLIPANVQARAIDEAAEIIKNLADAGAWVSDLTSINKSRGQIGYDPLTTKELTDDDVVLGPRITIPGNPAMQPALPPAADGADNTDQGQGQPRPKGKGQKANLSTEAQRHGEKLTHEETSDFSQRLSASAVKTPFRTADSPYWHEKVHPTQTHIDFASLHQATATAGDRIAGVLKGPARAGVIARIAKSAAEQLQAGKRPSELTFAHDSALEAALMPEIKRAYDAIRKATRGEIDRQWRAKFTTEAQRTTEKLAYTGVPTPEAPSLVAESTVQDVVNRYAAAARNVANGLDGDEIGDDVFVNALHGLADSGMDRIAMESARDAMREARTDEMQESGLPADSTWRRSALLDQNTCAPCMDADGAEIDGPDDDLSDICEGNDACRCVPYCDLTE